MSGIGGSRAAVEMGKEEGTGVRLGLVARSKIMIMVLPRGSDQARLTLCCLVLDRRWRRRDHTLGPSSHQHFRPDIPQQLTPWALQEGRGRGWYGG